MKMKTLLSGLAASCLFASCTEDLPKSMPTTQDYEFIRQMAYTNMLEVETGNMALSQGSGAAAWYGNMMVSQHSAAQAELQAISSRINTSLPTALDSAHTQMRLNLVTLSGSAFDSAYILLQLEGHMKARTLLQQQSRSGINRELKAYAEKYLPAIEMHYRTADSIYHNF